MRLYLAHPFVARQRIRTWELLLEERTGIEFINPFYDIERGDVLDIDADRCERYAVDPCAIVAHDLALIAESDGLIAYIDGSLSYGTIMEIVYACDYGQPVCLIVTNGEERHPWLQYHADLIFTSLDEFEAGLHLMEAECDAQNPNAHLPGPDLPG